MRPAADALRTVSRPSTKVDTSYVENSFICSVIVYSYYCDELSCWRFDYTQHPVKQGKPGFKASAATGRLGNKAEDAEHTEHQATNCLLHIIAGSTGVNKKQCCHAVFCRCGS